MRKSLPPCWALIPDLLTRITEFCHKYSTDSNPQMLTEAYVAHFVAEHPDMLAMVGLNGEGRLCGHILVSVDTWFDHKYLTILQYQHDDAIPQGLLEAVFDKLKAWGEERGCTQMQVLAQDEKRARAFQRFYRFRRHRILMRRGI